MADMLRATESDDPSAIDMLPRPRLDRRVWRRLLGAVAVPIAYLLFRLAIDLIRGRSMDLLLFGAIMLVIALFAVALYLLGRRNMRLMVGPSTVSFYDLFGRRRAFPRYDVGQLRRLSMRVGR